MEAVRERIEYLDGLRGLAILAVVLFHGYVAYPNTLPFGDKFEVLPIRLGWQGVQLFFLISGFVILMSLETCQDLVSFVGRRWLRLFPAMLICSVFILGAENLIPVGLNNPKTWVNLIPGLTFVNPALIHALTGLSIDGMEGSFWSLYVEVVFYGIFALAYFVVGRAFAILLIFLIFIWSLAMRVVFGLDLDSAASRVAAAADWIGFIHFGWFASGALFYIFYKDGRRLALAFALFVGAISALTVRYPVAEQMGLCLVVLLFTAVSCMRLFQQVMASRMFVFFGFVSYPLYLIHYPIIRALLPAAAAYGAFLPSFLLPVTPIACAVAISWLVASYGEPAVRRALVGLRNGQKVAGTR